MLRHVVVLASVGVLWGCSEQHSVDSPEPVAGSKLAVKSFTLVEGHDYDPFKDLKEEVRIEALGGITGATDYYKLIIGQMAQAMQDKKVREILRKNVPSWEKGEVKISELSVDYPYLLTALARNFKANIQDQKMLDRLARITQQTQFDEKALLQVVGAMFDLEVTLVNPPGEVWDGKEAIGVFYIPIDDNASEILGMDASMNLVALDASITEAPYSFLSVNFDESPLEVDQYSSVDSPAPFNVWDFFVSSAYAHTSASPSDCIHQDIIAPALEIEIHAGHEPGFWNDPEIAVYVYWHTSTIGLEKIKLPDVDEVYKVYTKYAYKRTKHGTCGATVKEFKVVEEDIGWNDTLVCWKRVQVPYRPLRLVDHNSNCSEVDADLVVKTTEENARHAGRGGGR